jgi:anti-sigma-K factor RskA
MRSGADFDLSWLALQYVCGELPAAEAAAFEQRLDHDQVAREAVAEAVALAGAVAQVAPDSVNLRPVPTRRVPFGLPRVALGVAASLLVALGLRALWIEGGTDESRRGLPLDASLAVAWSGVHEGDEEADGLLQWLDTSSAVPDALQVAVLDASEAVDADIPSWLLDAASLSGGSGPGPDERKEN